MKKILLFLLFLPALVSAEIVINEVYYDPVATETGGEAIELYNNGNESIDISGYTIMTESSAADATIPDNIILQPFSHYLIADTGWSENKDNESWPDADYEEAITLTNTNAGVALVYNGTIIDAVGWGSPADIDEGLYEGTPHSGADPGMSLQRINNSGNNAVDFGEISPELENSIHTTENGITLSITVIDFHAEILDSLIKKDDDNLTEGVQILPLPGAYTSMPISAVIEDENINNLSVWVSMNSRNFTLLLEENINDTSAVFSGNLEIEFHYEPGIYEAVVHVKNFYNLISENNLSFEYMGISALDIDTVSLHCEQGQGTECEMMGDSNMSTSGNITIRNLGNTELDVIVSSTNFTSGNMTFPLDSIEYSFSDNLYTSSILTTEAVRNELGFQVGSSSLRPLSFRISIPQEMKEGNYAGSIMLVAASD